LMTIIFNKIIATAHLRILWNSMWGGNVGSKENVWKSIFSPLVSVLWSGENKVCFLYQVNFSFECKWNTFVRGRSHSLCMNTWFVCFASQYVLLLFMFIS
jgi:hypothetical protein